MEITKLEIVDWEPCALNFFFSSNDYSPSDFKGFVCGWLENEPRPHGCNCHYRYAQFDSKLAEHREAVKSEWLCEKCVQVLANEVERRFPNLRKVELGFADSGIQNQKIKWLEIPEKMVEFEDGSRVQVPSFSIGKRPISTDDYVQFVGKTGYLTEAEIQKRGDTYRDHCGFSGLGKSDRKNLPVQFVTIKDAEAYCNFIGCRLPTEAEWLAASIINSEELDLTPLEELNIRNQPVAANMIEGNCSDLTSSRSPDGRVIVRRGPLHFLKKGWRDYPYTISNRQLIHPGWYDMSITFRLVKITGQ